MKRLFPPLLCLILLGCQAQVHPIAQLQSSAAAAPPANAEFLKTADDVLAEMSSLLSLPVVSPLKKSLRSRQEIRDYVIRNMKKDKDAAKRYADQKVLEQFGLLPPGFPLDSFLVEVLTEQVAGLYDPKSQEFYIADWIQPEDQREVMAHELTHALQDQHYHVDAWLDAAKPNDDAELAREAVLEGSAMAAMLDYALRGQSKSVRDLGDFDASDLQGDPETSPVLAKAPPVLRDELLFPYSAGANFTQKILRATRGWPDFHRVFEKPPVSTQQVMHPELYLRGYTPAPLPLPDLSGILPPEWKKLDENILGEFGLLEVLKTFLGEQRAKELSPAWAGDRYALYEHSKTKELVLVFRLRLASGTMAARFFGNYSEALEKKHAERSALLRRPNFFSFETPAGGVFLRCQNDQCFSVEGVSRKVFDQIIRVLSWPASPEPPRRPSSRRVVVTVANLPERAQSQPPAVSAP